MKKLLFLGIFFCYTSLSFAQLTKPVFNSEFKDTTKRKKPKPIEYIGYLEFSSAFPISKLSKPTNFIWDSKYWINKKTSLIGAFGFGWQFSDRLNYSDEENIIIKDMEEAGAKLARTYNYLSGRFKLQTKGKVRPYVEVGSGWLYLSDRITYTRDNPNYNPNHTCPEGSPETIGIKESLRKQHRFAVDIEGGVSISLNKALNLQLGVGYLKAKNIYSLEESNVAFIPETAAKHTTYQWENKAVASAVSLKIGLSFLIFNDPNVVHIPSEKRSDSWGSDDDSGGGNGGGGCN